MMAAMRDPAPIGLVHALGLLAGLGGGARGVAGASESTTAAGAARTCIDAGRGLLVTLRAPGPVAIGLADATGHDPAPTVRRWRRRAIGAPETGESLIFGAPAAEHWPLVRDYLPGLAMLGQEMLTLRARGRVYMATRREPETGESWIAFALHHRQLPRETLAAIGRTGVWNPVVALLSDLFGRAVTEHSRPWSIALPLGGPAQDRGLVRLGTTAWARVAEDHEKPVRLARQIERLGGDGSLAEAAYGLVRRATGASGAVGAACEFDVEDGRVLAALYTLRASERRPAGPSEGNGEA